MTRERAQPGRTVREYGAAGDGSTDDTTSIQAAIDDGPGTVELPGGRYRVTEPLVVELEGTGPVSLVGTGTPTIEMVGSGPAVIVRGTHSGTASPDTVTSSVWSSERFPIIDGLEIVGCHAAADGLKITKTMQCTLSRLLVRETRHAIRLADRNRNVTVADCHLYDNRGKGLYLDEVDLHQINVHGCHVSYNDGGGIVAVDGAVRNLQVAACDIESNMAPGAPPTANLQIDMSRGSLREGAIVGCTLQHASDAADSANVRLSGHGPADSRKVGHFVVANNAMSDVRHNVHVEYGRGVVIQGNTLWKGFDHHVLVEESSNVVIGPNLLDRNPDYGPPDSSDGIVIRDSSEISVNGIHVNDATGGNAGVDLEQCDTYKVADATLVGCQGPAIRAVGCNRGMITDNLVAEVAGSDAPAIVVRDGSETLVGGNHATDGIEADSSAVLQGNHAG